MSHRTCDLIRYFSLYTAALSPCVCVVCFTVCLILGPLIWKTFYQVFNEGQVKKEEMFLFKISLKKRAMGTF